MEKTNVNSRKTLRALAITNTVLGFASFGLVVIGVILLFSFSGQQEPPKSLVSIILAISIVSEILIIAWVGVGIAQCPLAFKIKDANGMSPIAVAITMGIFSGLGLIFWIITLVIANGVIAVLLLIICLGVGIFNSIYTAKLKK